MCGRDRSCERDVRVGRIRDDLDICRSRSGDPAGRAARSPHETVDADGGSDEGERAPDEKHDLAAGQVGHRNSERRVQGRPIGAPVYADAAA